MAEPTQSEGERPFDLSRALKGEPKVDASPEEKADYGLARFVSQNDHYVGLYQTWSKALLFLMNKHWLKWNPQQRRYNVDADVPPWRQQPVTNVTYAVYRQALAKLTKQRPTLECVPPSGDSDDRESAHLGQSLLVHNWRATKKPQKLPHALGWLLATGNAWLDVFWDAEAGPVQPRTVSVEQPNPDNPEDPNDTVDVDVAADEHGEAVTRKNAQTGEDEPDTDADPEMMAIGDIGFGVESPMSVRMNPEAESVEDAWEMIVGKLWPRERAAEHFGVDAAQLANTVDEDRAQYDDLLSGAMASSPEPLAAQYRGNDQGEAIGERVLVVKYFRKQCREYPQGRHWIVCGRQIVFPKPGDEDYQNGEAPLPNGFWPPLVPLQDTPVPGQPQALGLIPQVVPLNEQLNYIDGKIAEHNVTMAMGGGWWVHPDDKNMQITSEPAQVKVSKGYVSGKPPVQWDVKPLPEAVFRERDVLNGKIQLVSGLGQLGLGQKPEGVTSGRGFLVLQEATDSVYAPTMTAFEAALEEVGRRELVLAQRFYREDRMIQIRGERGQWEFRSFTGADLVDGLDVRVQVGSSFPWSKSAQWDARMSVIEALPGLVVDTQTGKVNREALARYLDTGAAGLGAFESDEDPTLVETQREHAMFEAYDPASGQQQLPEIGFWQDHNAHLASHYEFMSRDRGRFDRWSPTAQRAFLQHMQKTAMAIQEQVDAAMPPQPAQPAGGGPGGAPGGGGGAPAGAPMGVVGPGGGGAPGKPSDQQLTRGDMAAAGQ